MEKKKQKLIVILGPTASGKTDLGIYLAKKYNGEIISADSRLVYKNLNIGTAKPEKDNLNKEYLVKGIPHYMIDICPLGKTYNAALFKKKAVKYIKDINKRNKVAFLVGGTGLYIDAIAKNIDFPEIIPDKKLRQELEKKSTESLFEEYKKIDRSGADKIDKNNRRRLIRAIEVCKLSKKSFWENRELKEPIFDILKLGIKIEKEDLLERINKRINKMFKQGLQTEATSLLHKYGNIPPLRTIGYQEWIGKEKPSKLEIESIKERIVINTNKFAKRQMTWFKRDHDIKWIKDKKEADKLVKEFIS
jgi:tRNA dimethylallyltransferase